MNKVLSFLEKHVQWIAVGIAGLIFLCAIWVYWLQPDQLAGEVRGRMRGPAQVDEAVLAGPGQDLRNAMNDPRPLPEEPIRLADQFRQNLALQGYTPPQLTLDRVPWMPVPLALAEEMPTIGIPELPTLPPAPIRRLASGRSYVHVPTTQGLEDLAEVRVDYVIPGPQIASAFRRVAIPPDAQMTAVLRVQLVRQRQLGNGNWGEDQVIPHLRNNPLPPLPDPNAPAEVKQQYVQRVQENAEWVLRPPFYTLEAGDDPMSLEMVVQVGADGQARDPDDTDEEGQTAGGRENGDDDDGDGSGDQPEGGQNFANRGQGAPQGRPQTPDFPGGQAQPGAGQGRPAAQQPPPPRPAAQQPGGARPGGTEDAPLPPEGQFNAAQAREIEGWSWDTTARPGETYRYRVVYYLMNPLFGRPELMEPDVRHLADVLVIDSEESTTDWSPPITVEPLTYFYMVQTSPDRQQTTFTVFRWQQGQWQSETFRISPGDPVGYVTNGIDFRTGRTLVDVREDPGPPRRDFALLIDSEGRFSRRTVDDANDPRLRELQRLESEVAEAR